VSTSFHDVLTDVTDAHCDTSVPTHGHADRQVDTSTDMYRYTSDAGNMTVASIGLVSPGAVTDGVTLFFILKN